MLDPFCGSGTILVEAQVAGRNALGVDVDPVAIFVSKAKTTLISGKALRKSADRLLLHLEQVRRSRSDHERLQFKDISDQTFRRIVRTHRLWVPKLPSIFHWFRKYVVVDLARIRQKIMRLRAPTRHKRFFLTCLCSVIRNVSNADPVPVSGLEVTSHMKAKDAKGRIIDPHKQFVDALNRAIGDMHSYTSVARKSSGRARAIIGDATTLRRYVRSNVDVVITSPPYHNAVDYYRRHTLEMYWLNLVADHEDRLALVSRYVGRARVSRRHHLVSKGIIGSSLARRWERHIRLSNAVQADAFKHYVMAMARCFASLAGSLPPKGKAVFVVGKSSWNGKRLPTTMLFREIAAPFFRLVENRWYPLRNRYMTYSRRNNASIDREHVLVFKRVITTKPLASHGRPSGMSRRPGVQSGLRGIARSVNYRPASA